MPSLPELRNKVEEWNTAIKKYEDNVGEGKAPIKFYQERALAQRKLSETLKVVKKAREK